MISVLNQKLLEMFGLSDSIMRVSLNLGIFGYCNRVHLRANIYPIKQPIFFSDTKCFLFVTLNFDTGVLNMSSYCLISNKSDLFHLK